MTAIENFAIPYDPVAVSDLHRRLDNTRYPLGVANDDWKYGMQRDWLERFVHYWRHDFDWQAKVAEMNSVPNHRVVIDGIPIHFVHLKAARSNASAAPAMPIITTHGWPWTYWDYMKTAHQLAAANFDVVVPALPGFGWSSPLPVGHLTTRDVANLWNKLMTEVLGYPRYAAHGGDWGAIVTGELAHAHAANLYGAHITLPIFPGLDRGSLTSDDYDEEEKHYPQLMKQRMATATSHYTVQGIEPETLSYAMHDSPVGMAAWLIERRRLWSDSLTDSGHRDVETTHTLEDLATLVSIYWFSGSFWSSCRMYYGRTNDPWVPAHDRKPIIEAPTAMAVFPGDLIFVPRRGAEKVANIKPPTHMPAGVNITSAEQPELVASDVTEFFSDFR